MLYIQGSMLKFVLYIVSYIIFRSAEFQGNRDVAAEMQPELRKLKDSISYSVVYLLLMQGSMLRFILFVVF